jgi:YVTN family beta-propeller protein
VKPALSPDGSRLYVADNGPDSMTVINTNAGSPHVETTIAPGGAPAGVAISPDGQRLFVTYPDLGAVAEFEFDAASSPPYRVATTTVGSNPTALAISRDGSRLYVANNQSNSVSVICTTTSPPSVLAALPVGAGPTSVASSPDDDFMWPTPSRTACRLSATLLRPACPTGNRKKESCGSPKSLRSAG